MVRAVFCATSARTDQQLIDTAKIRAQLNEQLRCLEARTEAQSAILLELNEYYRRKAELDGEYGKQLEKLARNIMQKHKNERFKRELWPLYSTCSLWQQLVDQTKEEARQKIALADMYAARLTMLISQRTDDLQRISRKCREIGTLAHGEICRVLNELHTAMKTYQLCFIECSSVEAKFRHIEENKQRYEESNPTKLGTTRKHRSLAKLFGKRLGKFNAVKLKCLKARNEYLLCVQAANAALHKYFADDISDLIDCMDLGMDQWLRGLVSCTVCARKDICQKEMDALAELCEFKESLDLKADKQRFIEANHATFMLPKRFEFRGQADDSVNTLTVTDSVAEELQQRHTQIERRLASVRLESEEIWKTLESTEKVVAEKFADSMSSQLIISDGSNENCKDDPESAYTSNYKSRITMNELYDYYLGKFNHYMLNSNLIERLEARSNGIATALNGYSSGNADGSINSSLVPSINSQSQDSEGADKGCVLRPRAKKRIGSGMLCDEARRAKLFGGSLDEYVEATNEPIPLVVTSTIRVLSHFALHHQGIFRISGSQIEINAFKEAFEKGEDPLRHVVDATDINSIAGVLKLYLRELREPLFPIFLFDQLTECAKCSSADEFIKQVVPLIEKLSQPTCLVLRYLFAFLNHLSEFSDENMMDPYNLAICFGPTLLPIPEGKDQVFYHNFVNELVKNLIVYHEQIFSPLLPGPRYEKYFVESEHALYIDEQESAVSGDDEAITTPTFDCNNDKRAKNEMNSLSLSCSQTASDHEHFNAGTSAVSSRLLGEVDATALSSTSKWKRQPENVLEMATSGTPLDSVTFSREQYTESFLNTSTLSYNDEIRKPIQRIPERRICDDFGMACKRFGMESFKDFNFGSLAVSTSKNDDLGVNEKRRQRVSSTRVWSRKGCASSSLREQLHHTRAYKQQTASVCEQTSPSAASLDAIFNDCFSGINVTEGTSPGSESEKAATKIIENNLNIDAAPKRPFTDAIPQIAVTEEVKNGTEMGCNEPDLVRSLPHEKLLTVETEQSVIKQP